MTSTLAEPTVAAPPSCSHCGLPVPTGEFDPSAERQFCCHGCRTAWDVIHEIGLSAYYRTEDRRGAPVRPSGRGYEEFDHPAFQRLYARDLAGGLREIDLYLDGVHCASCVWLVERVPLVVPGAVSAELDVPRSLARVRWDPARTTLAAIARFLDQLGYPARAFRGGRADELRRAEDRRMLIRIGVAGALAINVMTVALALYAGWFGAMEASYVRYFRWVSLLLSVPAIVWPGRVFFTSALGALRARRLHMDVPIALALGAGFLRGAVNPIADTGPIYFDGVVTLIFLLLVGRFLQQRAQRAAADSAELLHALTPATARLVTGDQISEVPIEGLTPGAVVDVRAGDTVPTDGVVITGRSNLDLSVLTGESRPIAVGPDETVYAGTVNLGSALRVRVTESGETTRLGRILRELEAGMRRRAPVVHTADRLAGAFVGIVLVLAAVTWVIGRQIDPTNALDNAIALLIVTCPCALALATPLAMTVAVGRAAKAGILIRGGDSLEVLSRPGQLLLDKTGTLTEGRLALLEWTGDAGARSEVLALERHSNHPIARAFEVAWADEREVIPEQVEQTLGGGLTGVVNGRRVRVGSPRFVLAEAADPNGLASGLSTHLTPVLVARDGQVIGAAGFGDPIRPDAATALRELEGRGWTVGILSGDAPTVVAATAAALGVPAERARGGATPEEKLTVVEEELTRGPVAMVGDGVNDAPAIGRASVGIGVRGGAEACLAAADVFLASPGLSPLVALVAGAERTMKVIRRNIAISLGYNVLGAVLAMTGRIDPLIAAIMMPVSSLTVILISWRSRSFEAPR
ncbi:MAG: heavy metal translocating P-type ATPase [Gemmatimonadales bacterium]|nr:heavy metal translocating P-type ATPase [Gemmatimonadales bacterium]